MKSPWKIKLFPILHPADTSNTIQPIHASKGKTCNLFRISQTVEASRFCSSCRHQVASLKEPNAITASTLALSHRPLVQSSNYFNPISQLQRAQVTNVNERIFFACATKVYDLLGYVAMDPA